MKIYISELIPLLQQEQKLHYDLTTQYLNILNS